MIHLYRPGASVLHRLPAGIKLLSFGALALALSLIPHTAVSAAALLVGVGALYLVAGMPVRVLAGEVWRLRWLVLVLGGALAVFVSPVAAWISTSRVVALVLLASLLTLTTRMGDLLEVLHRVLAPLRRLGVDPDAVGLTVSMSITLIPVVAGFGEQIREAERARGVRLGVGMVVPLLVRTMRHADDVGDALVARGLV